jgi:hypothetical protein
MQGLFRGFVTLICGVAAFYFVFWMGGALLHALGLPFWISFVFSAGVSALVGRYIWARTASVQSGLAGSVVLGALITGGVGFVAGFFGPLVFAPDANQGPLLGLFITGPLGFAAGGVGGGVHWLVRRRRAAPYGEAPADPRVEPTRR